MRTVTIFITAILFSSIVSAGLVDIIIENQPSELYNLGDTISIPITIKSSIDVSGSFQMDLLCSGKTINFYKNGVGLSYGQEKKMDPSLVLTKDAIGTSLGKCKIKGIFKEDFVITKEFVISDKLKLRILSSESSFYPGDDLRIEGEVIRENGKEVNGFLEMGIGIANSSILDGLTSVNNGFFMINKTLPENIKSGTYSIRLDAYEKNYLGETTNKGFLIHSVSILQVPTSIEIALEDDSGNQIIPGTDFKVKAILHDQTGEPIDSNASISIYDGEGKLIEKTSVNTGEYLTLPIVYNEFPGEWKVIASSGLLKTERGIEIIENQVADVKLINKTVEVVNVGNVPYNKSVLVKIGNQSLSLDVFLPVDDSKKFNLEAPDGEYSVEVMTEEGNKITGMVALTGKAINAKESKGVLRFTRPFVWFFMIAILGFIAFMILKKGYKRSFFGRIRYPNKKNTKPTPIKKGALITAKNKAELSLSIKGEKQNISLVCLHIKNLSEIESKKSNAEESLQKMVNLAEEDKAFIYQNQSNLFFLLAPVKTKTFRNEKKAIEIAQRTKTLLDEHNKLFKQKIDYGLSLNYGTVVAKLEKNNLKFMSMGTLITTARKLSSLAHQNIFVSDKMNSQLKSGVKTEKHKHGNINYYSITELKTENHRKFINAFLERIDRDKHPKK